MSERAAPRGVHSGPYRAGIRPAMDRLAQIGHGTCSRLVQCNARPWRSLPRRVLLPHGAGKAPGCPFDRLSVWIAATERRETGRL